MGVNVSQVKPSNYFRLHTSMISEHATIPVPDSLYRRLEKLVLPSIFDTSFILDDVKLAELSNNSSE